MVNAKWEYKCLLARAQIHVVLVLGPNTNTENVHSSAKALKQWMEIGAIGACTGFV